MIDLVSVHVCVYSCRALTTDCPLGGSAEHPEAGGFSLGQPGAARFPAQRPDLRGREPRLGPLLQGAAWENAGLPL